ncbi:MAG: helix-turn-helix domain-containing protein [Algoriphagus sp.]|uniref:helix-turn-helix domain-containing protein n=1 Tax=Algoriphagus sp. TaxID=1872435 RepID=UPI002639ED51|nr:helix-turn-helix domain-containing protein [Algoriphagus sp.]MDG1276562.1 helix-turn-helix domain-containing protein [Algoriphagus sp.]
MTEPLIITTPQALESLIKESTTKAVIEALKGLTIPSEVQSKREILTRQEACKVLKISLPTLGEWTKQSLLKSYNCGGRIYYKSDELEKALKQIP